MARRRFTLGALACVLTSAAARPAWAQSDVGDEPAAKSTVSAPVLRDFVEAEYPAAALAERRAGIVVLRLTVGADGVVSAAEVVASAGDDLDRAAVAAAQRFRFEPALRDGGPVAARILYRYAFTLPPEAPSVPASVAPKVPATRPPARPVAPAVAPVVPAAAPSAGAVEVLVRGESEAERLRESAEAVKVVETERAKRGSADMGQVLSRVHGVGIQRGGGLGSHVRVTLNGLVDEQVRTFLDGVPLELAGFTFGVANVPVNFVERVEIYGGVVPIRFGSDALGGAINFVTSRDFVGTGAQVSYQVGSFDTHRLTLGVQQRHPSGLFARATAFVDVTENDYLVDVEVPDDRGRLSPARVRRFHDGYRATGLSLEAGLTQRALADRLTVRVFVTDWKNELQNNQVMTVPYGAMTYGEVTAGEAIRYASEVVRRVRVDAVAGYTWTRGHFLDVSNCVYDWYGACVWVRRQPGEWESKPHDQLYWDRTPYGRLNVEWRLPPYQTLRFAVAPTYLTREADERRQLDPASRDPLAAERRLFTMVNAVEYQVDLFERRLQNILFSKHYLQQLWSEEPRPGNVLRRRDRETNDLGFGNALRFRFTPDVYAKASYEWATRLPRPDEIFGDNAFIKANLELLPEKSHNVNLGVTLDAKDTVAGEVRGELNGFWREAAQFILPLGNEREQRFQNVYAVRSLGIEAAAGWTSPGEHVLVDGNLTYQDLRNTEAKGPFGDFAGDRLPSRPYLLANASVELGYSGLMAQHDRFSAGWTLRYVHEMFRGWESIGLRQYKQRIPTQVLHGAALTYLVERDQAELSSTLEVQNLTNAKAFDFFGVQKPGRAVFAKMSGNY